MKRAERAAWLLVSLALVAALIVYHPAPAPPRAPARTRAEPGVLVSMSELHRNGGVPPGWQPRLLPGDRDAGRAAFVELGCNSCHRVRGESFAAPTSTAIGPELSGMGSHHPPAYFAEAILDPDAVLVDGPGYVGADGHSIMPTYPDLTIGQLSDLVTYLTSLTQDQAAGAHDPGDAAASVTIDATSPHNRPEPPTSDRGRTFFAQAYDVRPDGLQAFESWFASEGRRRLLDVAGLLSVETFVDLARPSAPFTTVLGFRDEAALRNFMGDPSTAELWAQFDGFVGAHEHHATDRPTVYRVPSLSLDVPATGAHPDAAR